MGKVRRLLRTKRVGHAGTLDPAATGVLPIAVGKATRLLQFLPSGKAYQARIRFGVTTTTDDLEGDVLTQQSASELELEQIRAILPQFIGKIRQIPPRYSAIRVQGQRLYDAARKGQDVEVPERTVEVFSLQVLNWFPGEFPELDLAVSCGAGTYIRSIARDLGDQLQVGGTLANLIRTQSSGFHLQDSLTLEAMETQLEAGTFQLISEDQALQHLNVINLNPEQSKRWRQGQQLEYQLQEWFPAIGQTEIDQEPSLIPHRTYSPEREFLGISKVVQQDQTVLIVPQVVLMPY